MLGESISIQTESLCEAAAGGGGPELEMFVYVFRTPHAHIVHRQREVLHGAPRITQVKRSNRSSTGGFLKPLGLTKKHETGGGLCRE